MKIRNLALGFGMLLVPTISHAYGIVKSFSCIKNACALESNQDIVYKVSTENKNNSKLIILDILNTDGKSKSVPNSIDIGGKQIYYVQTALHNNNHFFRIVFISKPHTQYSVSKSGQYLSMLFNSKDAALPTLTNTAQTNSIQSNSTLSTPNTSNPLIQPLVENNANNEVVQYMPNQTVNIGLLTERTIQISFPAHIAKLITGINTQKISAEVVNDQLFLKPLADNIAGDMYIVCTNGVTYHLYVQTASQAPLTVQVIDAVSKKSQEEATINNNNTIAQFLIEVRNHSGQLDVAGLKNSKTSNLTNNITLQLTKIYQGTQFTAYEGIIKNISPVRIRVPYEKIYFNDLLGVAADDMYLNPGQTSKIWFVVSKGGKID